MLEKGFQSGKVTVLNHLMRELQGAWQGGLRHTSELRGGWLWDGKEVRLITGKLLKLKTVNSLASQCIGQHLNFVIISPANIK